MSVSTYPGHPIVTGASDSSLIRGPINRTGGLLSRVYMGKGWFVRIHNVTGTATFEA